MHGKQPTNSLVVQKTKVEKYNRLGGKAGESFFEKLVPVCTEEHRSHSYAQNMMPAQKGPEKTLGFHRWLTAGLAASKHGG